MLKKIISVFLLISFVFSFCAVANADTDVDTDVSSKVTNAFKAIDFEQLKPLLKDFWLIYSFEDSSNGNIYFRLVTSSSKLHFKYNDSNPAYVLYITDNIYRYDSNPTDYNFVSSSVNLSLDTSIFPQNFTDFDTDKFIYYTNQDTIDFYNSDGSMRDFKFTLSGGLFFKLYDKIKGTNLSDDYSSSTDPAWYDLFGWLRKIWESVCNVGKSILDGIGNILKSLFVPSDDFWQNGILQQLQDTLDSKFEFVAGFKQALMIMSNTKGQSLNFEFNFLGNAYAINFDWYEPYRQYIRTSFSALFFVIATLKIYRMFSSLFHINVNLGD